MISVDVAWEQVKEALSGDDYAGAFDTLEKAMAQAPLTVQATLALKLAHLHALYGEAALSEWRHTLDAAYGLSPELRGDPLARALEIEYAARLGSVAPGAAPVTDKAGELPALAREADPLVRYHVLAAWSLLGESQKALDLDLPAADLPPHLRWRLRSWQADAQENLGQSEEAALLYAEAAHLAGGPNRAAMLQEQAALLLHQGEFAEAATLLERARPLYGSQIGEDGLGLGLATWEYLMAQAQLNLGQPEQAQEHIREAARLEGLHGDPSYGVALVQGQVLSHLGQQEEALSAFGQALERASEADRPYANHELGVALLDLDRPVEAREKLEEVLGTSDYPFHPEVMADIAECDYRLGRLPEAQIVAEQALAQGAVVPASVVLGNVALDYYRLDEALEHYERVVREAAHGSRDWVIGHQMAADVMAQQGFPQPAAAYAHAQQALEHTPESDDWYVTLQDYVAKAGALMGESGGRTLN